MEPSEQVTKLIAEARQGDRKAVSQLFRSVNKELRQMAGNLMRAERPNHILQPTGLVDELYLKLFSRGVPDVNTSREFFLLGARAMKNILFDHARRRDAGKRGGEPLPLMDFDAASESDPDKSAMLILALRRLAREDPRAGKVIDLFYFANQEPEQIAELLETTVRTVQRDLQFAKLWLKRELS